MCQENGKGEKVYKKTIIGLIITIIFVGAILFFFISSGIAKGEIPDYVTGEMRAIYGWARSAEGAALLEQVPCYCGCKYDGHKNARHCFWRDDGAFDKHGITCSVCFDIAKKTKQMHEQGNGICDIVYEIDKFYASNVHIRTETPIPEGCTAYVPTGNEPKLPEGCGNEDALSCSL